MRCTRERVVVGTVSYNRTTITADGIHTLVRADNFFLDTTAFDELGPNGKLNRKDWCLARLALDKFCKEDVVRIVVNGRLADLNIILQRGHSSDPLSEGAEFRDRRIRVLFDVNVDEYRSMYKKLVKETK